MLPASLSARWLPREFVESTAAGGCFTIVAYTAMLSMFLLQLRTFLDPPVRSTLQLDQDVLRPTMQINFDIDMNDIECRNLKVELLDHIHLQPIEVASQQIMLTNIDVKGNSKGIYKQFSDEDVKREETEQEHQEKSKMLLKEDGREELDADWANSHDGFKHQSFEHVVQFHDFTLVNFFAGWCGHCQQFAPKWKSLADEILSRNSFIDRDGKSREVRPIKMNCVDFRQQCREQHINAFPTIRLYKSDGTFSRYDGDRSPESILRWIELVVRTKAYGWDNKREISGCNVQGYVHVPRAPGQLQLLAGGGDQNLEPTLTNVSHFVRHLSFSDPDLLSPFRMPSRSSGGMGVLDGVSRAVSPSGSPLDSKAFAVHAYHREVEHHLNVVSIVRAARRRVHYSMVHYHRIAGLPEARVPQARFNFDLEAFGIRIQNEELQWYDFATSMMAVLGGVFVLVRLLSRASRSLALWAVRASRKNGATAASAAAARGLAG